MPRELKIKFDRHGLGDCVHFAHALQLYKRRGYDVTVQVEENKLFIWKVAGVNIVQGGDLPDHSYHYPSGFDDLNRPDHETNKIAFGMKHDVMPSLSDLGLTSEQAWEELCEVRLSAHDHIPPDAHTEAERFLEGMPRPVICLHSRGTNWHERKSLPTDVAFDVILKLLAQTSGSVIVLDFDRRAPMVGDARCKGIKPTWGHIGIDRLCALFERSDLVIGVDSGPFHVASLTGVKALGVFRSLHPNRVCLPNPNAVYLVHHQLASAIPHPRPWNIETYSMVEPAASDIVHMALAQLNGYCLERSGRRLRSGRYLYRRIGHDERVLKLEADGTISEGAADCERTWGLRTVDGADVIDIIGKVGVICSCRKTEEDPSHPFCGRWTQFEQMPIELMPMTTHLSESVIPDSIFDGKIRRWSNVEASNLFPSYHRAWAHPVGTRGNGMLWLLDPQINRSDLDACGIDHEDWIFPYLKCAPGSTVLDLASFIGTNAIWWAKQNVRVIAVEPIRENCNLLYRNLALNQVTDNVAVIPKAFGRECGHARMATIGPNSQLVPDGDCVVEVTTIDHELLPILARLDVIKIDVEGAECDVLAGATQTLRKFQPRLVIEVHSHLPGYEGNGTRLAQQFDALHYRFRRIWTNTDAYFYVEAVPE